MTAERAVDRPRVIVDVVPRRRRRHQINDRVEQATNAKVGERGTEEDRSQVAGFELLAIENPVDGVEQFDAFESFGRQLVVE